MNRIKKLKIRKEVIVVLAIICILLIALLIKKIFFSDYSYEVEYEVDGFDIRENYDDVNKLYTFEITKDNINHTFYKNDKYNKKNQLIKGIEIEKIEDEQCLIIDSKFDVMPLCSNDKEAIDYRITSAEMQEKLDVSYPSEDIREYGTYKIYNNFDYNILIWDHKSILNISDDIDETKILTNDSRNFDLGVMINEYILIPDYDSKYSFNKFYIYNIKTAKKEEMKIDYDISYESYILGIDENSVYLVDKKNKVEYEIVPFKKKIRKVGTSGGNGTILTEKGFEDISITKLCSKELSFYQKKYYDYEIIDNKLYQITGNSKTRVSNQEIKDIISIQNDNVLFLVDDTLYLYNNEYGSVRLISNFDWKFEYKNLMFLYIP